MFNEEEFYFIKENFYFRLARKYYIKEDVRNEFFVLNHY